MKILIVAATDGEINPLIEMCNRDWEVSEPGTYVKNEVIVEFLVTGIGMVRTSFVLGKALSLRKPDLCINAGIAGAYPGKFAIGDVVHVVSDSIPAMGATSADGTHLSLDQIGLKEDISTIHDLVNRHAGSYDFLPKAHGITVDTVHGDLSGILAMQKSFDPDIETMESAAFFYACIKESINFIAIRAISNIVEPRDRAKWNVPVAIKNLNDQLEELLDFLNMH